MNHAIPAANKRVYVPSVRQKKAEPRAPLPRELVRIPATVAMRGVNWTGRPAEAEVVPARVDPVQPTMAARSAFAQVPWSGEKASDPTTSQSVNTVRRVLDSFRWE